MSDSVCSKNLPDVAWPAARSAALCAFCRRQNAPENIFWSQHETTKNDIKDVVKSYADVAQAAQKEMIEKAAVAQSSKSLVQSVVRQLDADKVEREKRKCNVVVLNAPEPRKEFSTEEKKKMRNFVVVFWTSHLITLKCAGGQETK